VVGTPTRAEAGPFVFALFSAAGLDPDQRKSSIGGGKKNSPPKRGKFDRRSEQTVPTGIEGCRRQGRRIGGRPPEGIDPDQTRPVRAVSMSVTRGSAEAVGYRRIAGAESRNEGRSLGAAACPTYRFRPAEQKDIITDILSLKTASGTR
jgi:hypothetical protein